MMILAPLAAMLIQAAISRSREFAADAGGAQIAGNPYGLADALRKIDAVSKRVPMDANPATAHMFIIKPFTRRGLMSLFSTHPPTEARIRALLGGDPLSTRTTISGSPRRLSGRVHSRRATSPFLPVASLTRQSPLASGRFMRPPATGSCSC